MKLTIQIFLLIILLNPFFSISGAETRQKNSAAFSNIVILTESTDKCPLGHHMELLTDQEGTRTIADVISEKCAREFFPSQWETPNPGLMGASVWVRFRLKSELARDSEWILEVPFAPIDLIECYLTEDSEKPAVKRSGEGIPFEEKESSYPNPLFYFSMKPGETRTVYMRYYDEGSVPIPLILWSPRYFTAQAAQIQYVFGLYYGIMLVMIFYNLFLFISVKDRAYLYYTLYVAMFGIFQMAFNGLAQKYLWPHVSIWWSNRLLFFSLSLAVGSMIQFSKSFLHTRDYTPKLHKLLSFSIGIIFLEGLLLFFLSFSAIPPLLAVTAALCIPALILTGILCWRKGFRSAPYYLIAFCTFLAGGLLLSLRYIGILPSNFFTEHGIQIGSALEVALLSLGLGDRINTERREKIAAQQSAIAAHQEAVEHLQKADKLKDRLNSALKEANTELEARVKERTEQLEKAMNAAEAANRAKSEFLANMSHEIRTPMNAILGFSEILLTKTENPEQKNYLKGIYESGTALLSLLNDILDLSKIEAGKMQIRPEPLNIRELLDKIRVMFFQKFQEKGLDFQVIADKNIPARLFLDESRIRQILANLVGNALKFTDRGYVKVCVSFPSGRSGTTSAGAESLPDWERRVSVLFEVEDTGIGILKDQEEVIFENFRQQDGQSTRKYGGTGLGLAITKRLTEMMDGTISMESEIGQGSIFRILLPNIAVADELPLDDESEDQLEGADADIISEARQIESKPDPKTELVIPDSLKANLPELTQKLENMFMPRWEEISEILVMDEIEAFASDLGDTAQEYHFEYLIAYGSKLHKHAENYNVDEVQQMIDDFPRLIKRLKAVH